jgi:nucleoid-associated protein YgaU
MLEKLVSTKLEIKNTDTGKIFKVQFNPERYTVDKTTTWTASKEKGKTAPLVFGGTARKSISFEFFFDTYAEGKDVREEYVGKLLALMEPTVTTKPGNKRPPILLISWSSFVFKAVLERLSQNYTLFTDQGKPVRAVVNATFKQYSTAQEDAQKSPPGDPTTAHLVKEGETLNLIAAKEYGDPRLWRLIADKNRLRDPLHLEVGTLLEIPPLL